MEDLYRLHHHHHHRHPILSSCASDDHVPSSSSSSSSVAAAAAAASGATATTSQFHQRPVNFGSSMLQFESSTGFNNGSGSEISNLIKSQIANHPRYPNLVSAFIACQKVGAPPEMATIFEEIYSTRSSSSNSTEIGADPELDQFMEQYCEVLYRCKEELSRPFDEATTFLNSIESQLNNLCNIGTFTRTSFDYDPSDEAAGTSEEEISYYGGEAGEPRPEYGQESSNSNRSGKQLGVKGMLMRKYSGHLSSLKKEFLKKRKRGKLPKDARLALLDWWNSHYRWPYPTEEEKAKLSEETGLDQKQISNWFINQRKRHWKPSEDMRFALLEDVTAPPINNNGIGEPMHVPGHT